MCLAAAQPIESDVFSDTTHYPLPNIGNVAAHDPSIIYHDDHYYMFKGGIKIPIFKSSQLSGPWEKIGTVLDGDSIVRKQNRSRPWAPTVTQWKGRFYCFYSISRNGRRNSAIGLASVTNAIDPAFFVDPTSGKPYLQYGSYWNGIFQIPLTETLSITNPKRPNPDHLAYVPNQRLKPIEGSFLSYKAPYYYTWFSHGQCCHFPIEGFPRKGDEYSIRVGRSTSVHGPFADRDGKKLLEGGGSIVYGSNHREVYAPGGLGVLSGSDGSSDILYYHYLNTTIGVRHKVGSPNISSTSSDAS
ncbi:hypothetical protein ASPVEDRAFT_51304 [Aspergillus versicolor CBS 583.65]|uniref:arabinan endo-1,5-alpha-L-arabinosidase n=1 Tax=Aspergillus versicolor CBS 583.65 TaxID=1036611 RepID=A0A1L9PF17_ASPVE|nr:uncharacterized protein ASPVEDRAFT_51304 [Aspergillus versicolor CBS 583.65]OJJ00035.1 hypothetical protein ASPVEDRAFT_51304 [Aspergillus versicolor CBS 583.65]